MKKPASFAGFFFIEGWNGVYLSISQPAWRRRSEPTGPVMNSKNPAAVPGPCDCAVIDAESAGFFFVHRDEDYRSICHPASRRRAEPTGLVMNSRNAAAGLESFDRVVIDAE